MLTDLKTKGDFGVFSRGFTADFPRKMSNENVRVVKPLYFISVMILEQIAK